MANHAPQDRSYLESIAVGMVGFGDLSLHYTPRGATSQSQTTRIRFTSSPVAAIPASPSPQPSHRDNTSELGIPASSSASTPAAAAPDMQNNRPAHSPTAPSAEPAVAAIVAQPRTPPNLSPIPPHAGSPLQPAAPSPPAPTAAAVVSPQPTPSITEPPSPTRSLASHRSTSCVPETQPDWVEPPAYASHLAHSSPKPSPSITEPSSPVAASHRSASCVPDDETFTFDMTRLEALKRPLQVSPSFAELIKEADDALRANNSHTESLKRGRAAASLDSVPVASGSAARRRLGSP
ncbi:hypothetical protein FA95DRAFT_1613681 [Auriscalpium vulgare]|uniref:Uncharacterized protein n=1 Tax=Auriscalpium vulgare TaxID=40419 RepID=A0ACB8R346_9AGAM|nr:hypothetical protein FA95DRAFT_1613681 [Auriscalpium vulgare]